MLAAGAVAAGWWVAAVVLGALGIFLVSFFRDPERTPGGDESSILSPADGTVLSITDGPPEAPPGASRRISIFMSVFNCHVNRSAVTGVLADYEYCPGKKLKAFEEKCSTENEQNHITLEAARGRVMFKQIAGILARRIVFYPSPGDRLSRGQKIGIILFGSRVDLFVPDGADLSVRRGDKVRAGRTELARWK
ncbi:MAG TPA: phosphatidylserine decarboxylase [Thermoanaerobaculia bacterium]|nr:phosphatidylserine decarboxylase [Thermoanaerobaculia bacterium]